MTTRDRSSILTAVGLGLATAFAAAGAHAQTSAAAPESGELLTTAQIESTLQQQGIRVKEIEIKDKVAEVDAHDAQGTELDLIVDRRNGEILFRKIDD